MSGDQVSSSLLHFLPSKGRSLGREKELNRIPSKCGFPVADKVKPNFKHLR